MVYKSNQNIHFLHQSFIGNEIVIVLRNSFVTITGNTLGNDFKRIINSNIGGHPHITHKNKHCGVNMFFLLTTLP